MEIRQKKIDTSHPAFQGHSRSLEPTRIDFDFLLAIYSNYAPSTVSVLNGDFGRKLQIFLTSCM